MDDFEKAIYIHFSGERDFDKPNSCERGEIVFVDFIFGKERTSL